MDIAFHGSNVCVYLYVCAFGPVSVPLPLFLLVFLCVAAGSFCVPAAVHSLFLVPAYALHMRGPGTKARPGSLMHVSVSYLALAVTSRGTTF